MKKYFSMIIGLVLIGLQIFLPMNTTEKSDLNQNLVNPQTQLAVTSVTDYLGNQWTDQTSEITLEVGEYYTVYAHWDATVTSGKLIIMKEDVEAFELDANTTSSQWLNITFLIRSE